MEQVLLTALKDVVEDGTTARAISRIVGDRHELEVCRGSAYFHANGFLKCPLWVEPATGRKVVVHAWPQSAGRWSAEHIHDHRWDFASVLLCGGYRYELFEVSSDAELEVDIHEYRSLGASVEYQLVRSAPSRVGRVVGGEWTAPAGYALHRSVLHRLSSVQPGTVTLVLQGTVEADSTRVALTANSRLGSSPVVVRRPTSDELRAELLRVRELLRFRQRAD